APTLAAGTDTAWPAAPVHGGKCSLPSPPPAPHPGRSPAASSSRPARLSLQPRSGEQRPRGATLSVVEQALLRVAVFADVRCAVRRLGLTNTTCRRLYFS